MKELFHLNKYFYKYRWRLLLGVLFVSISNLFAILPAQVVRHAFDVVKESIVVYRNSQGTAGRSALYAIISHKVFLFGITVVAMAFMKGIFMFFMRQTIIVMSRLIEYDLKNEIYAHYQILNVSFFRRNNTGDLMARISEDVGRVRMYVGPAIMYSINLLVLFVLLISIMLSVNVKLTLYVVLPLPLLSFMIYYINSIINRKSEVVQRQLAALSTYVQEAFSGIRVLKTFAKENASAKSFAVESERYKEQSLDLIKTNALFAPFILILIGLSTLLTIYVGGQEVIAGRLTVGNIAEFIIYINMLTWPVASIGWVTAIIQRAAASQKRLNEFLKEVPEISSPANGLMEVDGTIEFKNVSFTYPVTGIKAINNLSFKLEKGKSLAILGKTGSGKSTLAGLLARLFDVTEGVIYIDNKNINTFDLGALRSQIGYVPQEVFLFSDTIANNISFGLHGTTENMQERILQAAKDAVIYDNIVQFPVGFETRIGERGITLSGGQKQRISIARAIIKTPKILVFDDCLSAVDTNTEVEILDNLNRIMQGRTTLLISHRISTIKHADTILVIDKGSLVEQGNHQSLLEQKGYYAELFLKQLLEQEIVD
jgi:ATP-binding cassette subfamily B multidrug efflux pump